MNLSIISNIILGVILVCGCIAEGYAVQIGYSKINGLYTKSGWEVYSLCLFNDSP